MGVIESGQLQMNDRLPSEAALARRFGVSRPIVREALGRLQALGFTESRPGLGTFVASSVAKLTLSFGKYSSTELNEIRRCLEIPAARLAAERRTEADLAELQKAFDLHDAATTVEEAVQYDGQFHSTLARATGNMLFPRLLEDLREILQEQSLAVSALRNRGATAVHEHRAILTAVIAGAENDAAEAMKQHLDAVEDAVRQLARQRSDVRPGVTGPSGRSLRGGEGLPGPRTAGSQLGQRSEETEQ